MEEQVMTFELASKQIKYKDIFNKDFLELEVYAISDIDPNRNKTHFTLESMEKGISTFVNKPILGFFKNGDFEQHNGNVGYDAESDVEYWDTEKGERILGLIRESDPVEIVNKDGLHWIKLRCAIWVQYCYKQVRKILKDRNKKVSVEIMVRKKFDREDGVEEILEFELRGITILGSKNGKPILEGIQGAHLSLLEDLDQEKIQEQQKVLSFAYQQIDEYSVKSKNTGAENNAVKEVKQEAMENNQEVNMSEVEEKEENFAEEYSIEIDKSKEAMSEKDWGSVDKTALRNKVVGASNFKTIADDIFLDLREGWEDGEVTKLKYPVMEINGNIAVYNRGALGSAKAYAEKNNETEVLSKLKAIYEHLDLNDEETYACDDHDELYEDENMAAQEENKEEEQVTEEPVAEQNACEEIPAEEVPANVTASAEQVEGINKVLEDAKDGKMHDLEKRLEEVSAMCNKYSEEIEEYKNNCSQYSKTIEELNCKIFELEENQKKYADYDSIKERMIVAEAKVWKHFCDELEMKACEMMKGENIKEEDIKIIKEKCQKGEYKCADEIKRDVAYAVYVARPTQTERYSTEIVIETKVEATKNEMTREERIAARCCR